MLYIVWCINKYFYTCKHSYSYFTSSLMSLFFPLAVGFTITSQEYYLCSKKLIWCVCLKLLITKYHNWKKNENFNLIRYTYRFSFNILSFELTNCDGIRSILFWPIYIYEFCFVILCAYAHLYGRFSLSPESRSLSCLSHLVEGFFISHSSSKTIRPDYTWIPM